MFLGKEGFSQDLEKAYHFKDNKTANDERKRLNIYGKPGYTTCTGLRANEVDPELIVDTVGKKSKKMDGFHSDSNRGLMELSTFVEDGATDVITKKIKNYDRDYREVSNCRRNRCCN